MDTLNVAEADPLGTVTVLGKVAAALPLDRLTVTPPEGAVDSRVTVPVAVFPPITAVGLSVTDFTAGGSMVRFADCEAPLTVAEMATANCVFTGTVFTVNVADVAPGAIASVEGTVA